MTFAKALWVVRDKIVTARAILFAYDPAKRDLLDAFAAA